MISPKTAEKRKRAIDAALEFVKDGSCIGLGSGSTMSQFIAELADRIRELRLNISVISSSSQVDLEAEKYRLNLITPSGGQGLDVVFDSADEVDENLNLLKGGGAALFREKILHYASRQTIILVEDDKVVKRLGTRHPLPVEVLPFALPFVKEEVKRGLGFESAVRMSSGKVGPLVTDNGNYILDIQTGAIQDPYSLENNLRRIPGVIETGLFLDLKGLLIIAGETSVQKMEAKAGKRG
jgi:ribose 5-phosphate isomerase A